MTFGMVGRLVHQCLECHLVEINSSFDRDNVPGWRVESTIFFAFHNSGVIDWISPCLYFVRRSFACSRPALDVSNVLPSRVSLPNSNALKTWLQKICSDRLFKQVMY